MNRLFIDDRALELIKEYLKKENADAVRIFAAGGGCCRRFEILPVKKALEGDVTYKQRGIKVHMEKEIAEATRIEIKLDEQRGLIIQFRE